jgi:hypothetical protein
MQGYQISFFNELANDSGHVFRCCQRVIEIRLAKSKDRAIEAAKRRFARQEGVSHWSIHAQFVEAQELNPLARRDV